MKILVAGANGFLGSEIARQCLKLRMEVWGTFNKRKDLIPQGCKKVPILKFNRLNDDFDIVFIAMGNFTLKNEELFKINMVTTTKISKKFKSAKLVFISSIAVYGSHKSIIDEHSEFNQTGTYGLSKIAGEKVVNRHKNYAIVRLTNLYGPGMVTKSFIPTIIIDALKKGKINLKNKARVHDFLSVQDAANLCIKAGQIKENEVLLGATGKSISNLEIAKIVQRITGCKLETEESDNSPSYHFNPGYTRNVLNWKPERSIKKDLVSLVKFYESCNI